MSNKQVFLCGFGIGACIMIMVKLRKILKDYDIQIRRRCCTDEDVLRRLEYHFRKDRKFADMLSDTDQEIYIWCMEHTR